DSTHLKEKPEDGSIKATLLSGEVLTNLENNLSPSENYFHKHFKVSNREGKTGWINSGDVVWYPSLNNDSIARLKREGRIIREIKRGIKEKRSKWVENYSPVMKEKRGNKAINETISSYSQYWKRLYKKRLKQNNTISGRIKLKFVINPDGSTEEIEIVYSSIEDKKLKKEVIKLIREITFSSVPDKAGSVEVRYTLPFNKSLLVSDKDE
ncbi:MAG: TonB family protein, partial [Chitinivibrionales bacterium]